MADFVNTIDVLGDDAAVDSIIQRTITEFKDDQVNTIGDYAFHSCTDLKIVDLPNVTRLGYSSFEGCTSLESANLPNVTDDRWLNQTRIFARCANLKTVNMPKMDELGDAFFTECSSLDNVYFPNLEVVGESAFNLCKSLKRVCFPRLTEVKTSAFRNCYSLEYADLPVLGTIARYAFNGCSNLSALVLRSEVLCDLAEITGISGTAIAEGTGFVYVPSALMNQYRNATNWSTYENQFRGIIDDEEALQGIIDETLVNYKNDTITSIPNRAFYNYMQLKTLDLPNVTSVDDYAFYSCDNLTSINLPNLSKIPNYAHAFEFVGSRVPMVRFPKVETIGYDGLRNSFFYSVDLPTCTSIGDRGFYCAKNLSTLILRSDTICSLGGGALNGSYDGNVTPIAKGVGYIYVPRALVDSYKSANNWSTYANQFRAIEDYEAESISLSTSEMVFTTSDSQTLTATATPSNVELVWSCAGDVIKLDDGVVTPLYDGTATITVTDVLGSCRATCTVTVSGVGEAPPKILYSLPEQTTLNGTSDYIDTGIKLFDTPKSFTMVCTAEFNKLGSNKCLFHCMNEAAPYPGVSMDGNSGARVCYTGITSLTTSISPAYSIKTIVLRYVDGVLDAIKYFDTGGKLNNVNVNANASYTTVDQNLILGAYQTTNGTKGRYYAGTIYNFDVYAFAMSDDEIAALS